MTLYRKVIAIIGRGFLDDVSEVANIQLCELNEPQGDSERACRSERILVPVVSQ